MYSKHENSIHLEKVRRIFIDMIREFPDLDISITSAESTSLNFRDPEGNSHSLELRDVLDANSIAGVESAINETQSAIFKIKEVLKRFDS